MGNKISGKIIILTPTQSFVSAKGTSYDSREFVIERLIFDRNTGLPTSDPYDTPIFKLIGENCRMLDEFKVGDEVTVDYDLSGRNFVKDGQTKYFTDVKVYRITLRNKTKETTDPFANANIYNENTRAESVPQAVAESLTATVSQSNSDDLPF